MAGSRRGGLRAGAFLGLAAAAVMALPLGGEEAADRRLHVRAGSVTGSEPIILSAEGAKVAFTASFSIPESRFVPDPYAETCARKAVKYTLKTADQKEILGAAAAIPDPDSEDALVLHPFELRNAAAKLGANAVYLLLSDSESVAREKGLHDCAIVDKDGDRRRGESLQEIACRTEQGAKLSFSRYAGQARFYTCRTPAGK
ncbi:MAG TPA: hypothetical protein VKH46_07930 [Thermoanaerobaculia bacterium]|nr:hypothetical protein [Thermoanaerobaculia bacterium]